MAWFVNPPASQLPTDGSNRILKFRSRFPEVKNENLVRYIPCNWRKSARKSLHGGLYLTDNHIGFYCASRRKRKRSESERKILIDVLSVVRVAKIRSLSIFPDSILIEAVGSKKYVFSQLFSRNAVYKTICSLCGISSDSRRVSVQDPHYTIEGDCEYYDHADEGPLFHGDHDETLHSISSSGSSSSSPDESRPRTSSFNRNLQRMLSVVPESACSCAEVDPNEVDSLASRSTTRFVPSSYSRSVSQASDTSASVSYNNLAPPQSPCVVTETAIGKRIIQVMTLVAAFLIVTAVTAFYRLCVTYLQSSAHDEAQQRMHMPHLTDNFAGSEPSCLPTLKNYQDL
ncbi:uncharacterized protein LOC129597624 [Paramacrobiotus metropolitanus]|uniref:uncharacterized protein LOC129597624 n=1 Tax=Paramacrobiotus metropolitanus TaxID=2943436 RepID=UPI002445AAE2|nr:uncharacterized protein LOC129597624 [Paramacrobiotus metropolitanus]XP_055351228.1 uncharacterized protein LOC129597624 [Paramacrobiotus metropolitanus]XP_055351229.1 uncharacterized protein LOC129597624 [Paramacrobiotus metropolitanus]